MICDEEASTALVARDVIATVWLASSAKVPAVAVTALLDELACLVRRSRAARGWRR